MEKYLHSNEQTQNTFINFSKIYFPILILVVIIITTTYNQLKTKEYKFVKNKISQFKHSEKNRIDTTLNVIKSDLLFLSKHHELKADLDYNQLAYKSLINDLITFSAIKTHFDQIRYIDKTGKEVIRVNYNEDKPYSVRLNKLQEKANRYYVQKALKMKPGKIFVSELDLNMENEKIEIPFKPVLRFATPVTGKKGNVLGILVFNYNGKQLLSSIISNAYIGNNILINDEGYYLKGFSPQEEWGSIIKDRKKYNFEKRYAKEWEKINSANEGQFITDNGLFSFVTISPNVETTDTLKTLENNFKNWKYISIVKLSAIEANLGFLLSHHYILILVIGILLAAMIWYIVKTNEHRKHSREVLEHNYNSLKELIEHRDRYIETINSTKQELNNSEENFNKIFQTAPIPMAVSDLKTRTIQLCNSEFATQFGYQKENIINKKTDILYFDSKDQKKLLELLKKNKYISNLEMRGKRKDGSAFWSLLSLRIISIDGKFSVLFAFYDISSKIELQTQLEHQVKELALARRSADKANQSKTEFLTNMSHEIRTPMNTILGFTDILSGKTNDAKHLRYLNTIASSGKTLLALINDILDLSKVEAGKIELHYTATQPSVIIKEIKETFAQSANEKKLKLQIVIDPKLPQLLLLDEIRLRQVLLNLVSNAIKFTDKGSVTISAKASFKKNSSEYLNLVFSVEDTGIGIPQNLKNSIFKPFEQRIGQSHAKYGGTGLGLAISKRLAQLMNGNIKLSSKVNRGSNFTVTIKDVKIINSFDPEKKIIKNIKTTIFKPANILIVDDVKNNRELLKEYLYERGLKLIEADNGKKAIDLCRKNPPDLILMDIEMPIMNGYDAIRIIKKDDQLKSIPIVAVTASAMKARADKIRRITDGYLRKPVSEKQLLEALIKWLPVVEKKE
ncbi:MAG: ATP-binding protein [Leptospirales bacterium]